ncbi:MAG TPA: carboxypeptidase-like regulatory domain-containing protein [Chitinophagaceae bacterium]|nr:carboxypeptidase-like regulatory domain-containing protein [Chitinophagaceae bacterium]
MNKILRYIFLLFFVFPKSATAQFETIKDSVVQLYGLVMTSDSLKAIPGATVLVKGQNRGTITNNQGVFSIVVLKGDVVEFTHVSYKPVIAVIPKNLEGNQYSVVQLLVADTVYLPATIIKAKPTRAQFERDFVSTPVPDDDISVARKNNDVAKLKALAQILPADGREAVNVQFRQQSARLYYAGQQPPINLFNPAAWNEFIKAWKRGDFRRK